MNANYDMIAGITGESVIDLDALDAMLDWFLADECLLLIADPPTPGTERIVEWCEDVNQPYIRTQEYIPEILYSHGDPVIGGFGEAELNLIVLGVEGRTQVIQDTWNYGIEVFDLSRAMYPVVRGDDLDLVVYEPETQPHELSDSLGGRGSLDIFVPQNGSESRVWTNEFDDAFPDLKKPGKGEHLHKPYEACHDDCPEPHLTAEEADIWEKSVNPPVSWLDDYAPGLTQKELVERLREEMAGIIKAHEERYHGAQIADRLAEGFAVNYTEHTDSGQAGSLQPVQMSGIDVKIRCLKDKNGKIKVSPRAKPKANETVTWLTQEEVDNLEI